jgi:hypothetical protein
MKTRIVFLTLATLAAARPALAQDSTWEKGHSWRPWTPWRNVRFDLGLGRVPYLDRNVVGKTAVEVKLISSIKWLPDWSAGVAAASVLDPEQTSYVAPETITPTFSGIHPELISTVVAFEVQRRWDEKHGFHPLTTIDVGGHVRASYLLGYRSGGRMTIEQAVGSNGGPTMIVNLQLGKF